MTESRVNAALGDVFVVMILVALIVVVFGPVVGHEFLVLDDPECVTANPHTSAGLSAEGARWAFTTFYFWNWHPLTWLSFQCDASLFRGEEGLWPGGFHLTNLLLHVIGVVSLYFALLLMTGRRWAGAMVAAIYAVHPFHVQSVAWIAERKGILSTAFGMLALLAYAWYARRPSLNRFLLLLLAYVASLCSKQMLVTLPFLFLLLDFWPMRRWVGSTDTPSSGDAAFPKVRIQNLLAEKIPLLFLAIGFSGISYYAQWVGGALDTPQPLAVRLANAVTVYAIDVAKTFVPQNFSIFYPYPQDPWTVFTPMFVGSCLVFLLICTAGAALSSRRMPFLMVGWCWYVVALAPVCGIVGIQGHRMADRFTDVPLLGLYLAAVWTFLAFMELAFSDTRWRGSVSVAAGVFVVSILASLARIEVASWKNDETVADRAIESTTGNYVAFNIKGTVLQQKAQRLIAAGGEMEGAEQRRLAEQAYVESLRINPQHLSAHLNLGNLYVETNRLAEATEQFREGMKAAGRPIERSKLRNSLAAVLEREGKMQEALAELHGAVAEDPYNSVAVKNYAFFLHRTGRDADSVPYFQQAAALLPDDSHVMYTTGVVLAGQRRREALAYLSRASALEPKAYEPYFEMGRYCSGQKDYRQAIAAFTEAARRAPGAPEPIRELAEAYAVMPMGSKADRRQAVVWAMHALEMVGKRDSQALCTLGIAQQGIGEYDAAVKAFEAAREILTSAPHPNRAALELIEKRLVRCRDLQRQNKS